MFKQLAREIDFTFNTIKDVKKVNWKDDAPWFREIEDGFCWIAYCHNRSLTLMQAIGAKARAERSHEGVSKAFESTNNFECPAFGNLVVIN